MLMTMIQKEIMHHLLSVRFVALLVMCLLLVPLTLSINYRNYRQNLVDYQEAVKRANIEENYDEPRDAIGTRTGSFQTLPQTDTFERLCKWISRCIAELSWYDTQWNYTRSTRPGVLSLLSVRAPRFSVRSRYRLQSTRVTVYIRCGCRGNEKRAPFGSP